MITFLMDYWWIFLVLAVLVSGLMAVNQGTIAVITMFGKYQRIMRAGLNFKIPLLEELYRTISTQNRSWLGKFTAITSDQANMFFNVMTVLSVVDETEDNIKKAAFKFSSDTELGTAITQVIEANIRTYVATRTQDNIISMQNNLMDFVKANMDRILLDWGYHVQNIQVTDILFDPRVAESMSKVVAAKNLAIANGLIGQEQVMFNRWAEAMENFAKDGKGNMIFADASPGGMDRNMKQILGVVKDGNNRISDQLNDMTGGEQ